MKKIKKKKVKLNDKVKKCHWNDPVFRAPCYCSPLKCKDCNQYY